MKRSILYFLFLVLGIHLSGQQFEYSFLAEYDPAGIEQFSLSTGDGFIDVAP